MTGAFHLQERSAAEPCLCMRTIVRMNEHAHRSVRERDRVRLVTSAS